MGGVSRFLACVAMAACLMGAGATERAWQVAPETQLKKIALVCTVYEPYSHADVVATKFMAGFPTDDGMLPPKVRVASMYIDQGRPGDLGHRLAAHYGIPIYETITGALTLGGDTLAVDGVLVSGEHGDYPYNRLGLKMYPRLSMLEEIFRIFAASGRAVPVFNDKGLSYRWQDAFWIRDRVEELGVPFMAGSSIPLVWRDPQIELPVGANVTEAVSLAYGEFQHYAIHGLEVLQSMMERRAGGETGVASVRFVQGPAFFEAARRGEFSMDLVKAACATVGVDMDAKGPIEKFEKDPLAILIRYRDGTRGAVLMMDRYYGRNWLYAARVDGEIVATHFVYAQPPSRPTFSYLGLNIQEMFLTGRPQYPFERTLLTTCILEAAARSRLAGWQPMETPSLDVSYSPGRHGVLGPDIQTPYLDVSYKPFDFEPIRPSGTEPTGASLMDWPPQELKALYEAAREPAPQAAH